MHKQHKGRQTARQLKGLALLLAALVTAPAWAQTSVRGGVLAGTDSSPVPRTPIKMDRGEFVRTHHWDEASDSWVLNANMDAPAGVMSRADVKAKRDDFLRNNHWDEQAGSYLPVKPGASSPTTLTRAQVKADTVQFMKMHRWDEDKEMWVASAPAKMRK